MFAIINSMELRHLRTFMATAKHQRFTRAAESLSLTQAAVSQHVAALEKDLGVLLFERAARSVTLTDLGRRLYEYSQRIVELVDEACTEISKEVTTIRGTLRIATSTVPAEAFIPELLKQFREIHPEVNELLIVSDSLKATAAVGNGEAELGIVGELPRDSNLSSRPITSDELVLILPCGHRFADRKKITLKQLRSEPIIVREPGSGSRRCLEQALEPQASLEPR